MSKSSFEGFDPEIELAFNDGSVFGLVKFNPDTKAFVGIKPLEGEE